LAPGQAVFEEVVQAFGRDYLTAEKLVDRRKLGRLVFADAAAREKLNALMHPAIFDRVDRWLAGALVTHRHAVAMVPLLYETGSEGRFARVLVVAAEERLAIKRMLSRGWTEEEARARMNAQWPVEEKIARADAIIWNNGDLLDLQRTTEKVWHEIISGKE
jgi:dephospho-CoA kinase